VRRLAETSRDGALCAIVLNTFLPEEFIEQEEDEFDPEASVLQVMHNPDVPPQGEPETPAGVAQLNRQIALKG
jgi:xanthine permease XanP